MASWTNRMKVSRNFSYLVHMSGIIFSDRVDERPPIIKFVRVYRGRSCFWPTIILVFVSCLLSVVSYL
jgi:hypothetical protein